MITIKKLNSLWGAIFLSGCTILPGMQNPSVSQMRTLPATQQIVVRPTLIPITPALITDQRISMYIYRVAPADVLNISVWQHPEFSPAELHALTSGAPSTQGAAGQVGYLV